ncbi:MAG: hypothetical protein IKF39_01480 [Oscillospiraceae bacterium]|nr:hypothetical protein [Oscillospiraceae bacterium]
MYDFLINPRAFRAILAGTKTTEIRVSTEEEPFPYEDLTAGDVLRFEDTESGQKLCVTVVSTQHYPDAESLLASEDIRVAMSSTNDPVVGAERIRSFPGYREGMLRNGVWAIRLKDPGLS